MPKEDSSQKKKILKEAVTEKPQGVKSISYSQYSVYKQCPYRWSLTYKQALYPFTGNVNSVFGTAFHETLQEYLRLLYTVSVKASDEMNFNEYLSDRLIGSYTEEVEKNGGEHFILKQELKEYYADGIEILYYLRRKRKVLFDYRSMELIAMELPGYVQVLDGNNKIVFNYYLDLVFYDRDKKMYEIVDIKTSTRGWKQGGYELKSQLKMDQVLLYKNFFSKYYNVPANDVNVKFLIVKRKVSQYEGFDLPRHSVHIPAQGTSKISQAVSSLEDFVKDVFNEDGSYKEVVHRKIPSSSACRFCPYADGVICNMEAD